MRVCLPLLSLLLFALPVQSQDFTYSPAGQLVPGSGQGRADETVYVPGMRFPIEVAPAYPNSQVWGHGGSQGPGGGQCDPENYSYPWWDNFCESRSWDMPLCPSGQGHQGQDIRASTCDDKAHWVVASEEGTITNIGSYSVSLMGSSGTRHRYLHMDPGSLRVSAGDTVTKGQRLGLVSNAFGGTPTTIHLHYDLNQNIQGQGNVYVPTYMSLVRSYEDLLGSPGQSCTEIPEAGIVLDNTDRCFGLFGNPDFWRHVTDAGIEGDLYWTHGWVNDTPGNWARWRLNFLEPGTYEVSVNALADYARSQQTLYSVRHSGEEATVVVDQSAGVADGWVSVGTFDFAAGEDQWVSVYDNTGEPVDLERRIMVDGVRLTRSGGVQPAPDAGMMPDASPEPNPEPVEPAPPTPDVDGSPFDPEPEPQMAFTQAQVKTGCACQTPGRPMSPAPGWLWLVLMGALARCAERLLIVDRGRG